LAGSFFVLTQAPLQAVSPVGHWHALSWQTRAASHTVPHWPQLLGSLRVFTQVLPHFVNVVGQLSTQAPWSQTYPAAHDTPAGLQLSPAPQ
jgi:hypothetical protein